MILGFRADINNDSHRIFLTRLFNYGVKFSGTASKVDSTHYSFLFDTEHDLIRAKAIVKSMQDKYEDIPLNKNIGV